MVSGKVESVEPPTSPAYLNIHEEAIRQSFEVENTLCYVSGIPFKGFKHFGKNEPKEAADNIANLPHVVFDLETTGLGKTCHITQIAAVGADGSEFSQYVLPKIPIQPKASEVTGLTCVDGSLYHNGQRMEAVRIRKALKAFMSFLGKRGVVLVAHNAKEFDAPVLLNAAANAGLNDRLQKKVVGFLDTLPLFRSFCPGLSSYKLEALFVYYTGKTFSAHEALEDARALKQVVDKAAIPYARKGKFVISIEHINTE